MQRMRMRRSLLVAQLESLSDAQVLQRRTNSPERTLLNMSPILTAAMSFALVSVVCVFVWLQQSRPKITSNALLVQAEAWDPAMVNPAAPRVIRQTVRIMTPQLALERTVYRDALGKRHLKPQNLKTNEHELKERLATAGVAWDAPLSATSYQDWHDEQRVRQDEIRRSGGQNLVLTTTTPNGSIASQSLTVRETDFHPIARTIAFRNSERVEIAELEYKILPWTSDSANLFEVSDTADSDGPVRRQPALQPALVPSPLPSDEQLDESELGVRLVLNKLQADAGEQIRIERSVSTVEVKGLVDTEERKRELVDELSMLPRVRVVILSVEELERTSGQDQGTANITVTSVAAHTSPLETYFVERDRDANALRPVARRLLNAALVASQESRATADLIGRFAAEKEMTSLAKGTLATLVYSHRKKLRDALQTEQEILSDLSSTGHSSHEPGSEAVKTLPMVDIAERNLTLCEELSLGSNAPPRSAESILQELATTLMQLRTELQQAQLPAESAAISTEKR
jgi:hypothetical protein